MTATTLQSLALLAVGMTEVLAALLLLALLISVFLLTRKRTKTFPLLSSSRDAASHTDDDTLNDELVAVLAAAATTILKRPVTVRRVRFLQGSSDAAWAVTGRLNIMASHAIARRKT